MLAWYCAVRWSEAEYFQASARPLAAHPSTAAGIINLPTLSGKGTRRNLLTGLEAPPRPRRTAQ